MPLANPERVDRQARSPASVDERRVVSYGLSEIREQMDVIEQLMVAGVAVSRIERESKAKWNLTPSRVRRLVDKVRSRWAAESAAERPHWKAQAIRRLYGHIATARSKDQWAAVAQFERLLAEMQGTREPVELTLNVDATVTEAALHAISGLTPERFAQIVAEQRRLRALAAAPTVVDTTGTLVNGQKAGSDPVGSSTDDRAGT